jgi:hypothetical protein
LARLLRLTPAYLSSAGKLGARGGSSLSREVLRVLRELAEAGELELPGADDLKTIRPGASGEPHIHLRPTSRWTQHMGLVSSDEERSGAPGRDQCPDAAHVKNGKPALAVGSISRLVTGSAASRR